jgi:hypothetical protein
MKPSSLSHSAPVAQSRPTLHLSGPKLRAALEQVIAAAETVGGIERFVAAIGLRAVVFQDRLADGKAAMLTRAAFEELLPLMPTVRRRIGAIIDAVGWPAVQAAIATLLTDAKLPGTADARIAQFESTLTVKKRGAGDGSPAVEREGAQPSYRGANHRCVRDLAAELLHAVYPEHYPLMTRWIWDATPNTGVLREIWHDPVAGDDVDHVVIDAPDNHEAFLVLREELSQFLSDNGIFKDMLWYVDVLMAQVYAIYINAQGGAYLKGDFQAIGDPLEHTRRILGLDRIGGRPARKIVEAEAHAHEAIASAPLQQGRQS